MGCLNGLILFEAFFSVFRGQLLHFQKLFQDWPILRFQFVSIIGHCVYKSNGTTGVPNGLLHEEHCRTDFLSVQLSDLFFPEVPVLDLLLRPHHIHEMPMASKPHTSRHFVQYLGLISISFRCIFTNHRRNYNPEMMKNLFLSLCRSKFLTHIISLLPDFF